jgi:hypothetical protein
LAQPQAGLAGQPAAQPGTGYPAQPGAGPSGATSSISIKGILIAAAAIVAVIIAVVAAFFVLRPNPPQQTAAQQSPTTAANPAPGADAPASGAESFTGWSGDYQLTSQQATSPCTGAVPDTLSVSVTGTAIAIVTGPVTWHGTMTASGTFAVKSDQTFGFEGNFARINEVATLNGKIFGTDPTGLNADCIHTFTATHRG